MPTKKASVPVVAPDGQAYMIPADQVSEAVVRGGKIAVRMQAPDGNHYWIPNDQIEEGMRQGGKLVQPNGDPYPEGTEPVIVGKNASGEPIWGSGQPAGSSTHRFLQAAGSAMKGAAEGLLDANPNEQEKAWGLTSNLDYWMRPLERVAEGQMSEGEEAADLAKQGEYSRAFAHGIASILPLIGPWEAQTVEQYYRQLGQGDVAGAIGTLGGNAAVAAAMEAAPKVVGAAGRGVKGIPGKIAEWQAPGRILDRPVSPGDLTPRERYDAAKGMGVNLDRAQATNAPIPRMAKRVTENSLMGNRSFEENNAANVQALHSHAQGLLDQADPNNMSREDFGNQLQQALDAHKGQLIDRAGTETKANGLLDQLDQRPMTREEFGDEAREALEQHRQSMLDQERGIYEDLDKRLGDQGPKMDAVREKARGIYEKNKRFYDNHPEALKGGDARVWSWVKDLAGVDKPEKVASAGSAKGAPADTWSDLQTARSHLLDVSRGPEFVGDLATGWAKQLVGAIDETMTSAEKTPGLSAKDVKDFRQANAIHTRLKQLYDAPQSPFYWLARDEGIKVADRLNSLSPQAARDFRESMGSVDREDLVGQQQRQFVQRLLDPAGNGQMDWDGFAGRWKKLPKEQTSAVLFPEHFDALDDLAQRSSQETPYDAAGSHLGQALKAPDGLAASRALFTDSGQLRLTPQEIRQVGEAAPELLPQLRRQAVSRLLDPTEAGAPDLRNFSSRWNRTQNAPLNELLGDEGMQNLDDLASVSRTVNLPTNPSQTAVVLQPASEAGDLLKGAGGMATQIAGGATAGGALTHENPVAIAAGATIPVAASVARGMVAKRLVDPDATAGVMAPRPPVPPVKSAALPGEGAGVAAAGGTAAAAQSAPKPPVPLDRRRQEGVSTPPNGGQVSSTETAEPNEVHDAQKEATALAPPQEKPPSGEPATTPPVAKPEPGDVMVRTGATSSGQPAPQAKLEPPEGATHEVLDKDGQTVIGHVVDGEYVPLETATA